MKKIILAIIVIALFTASCKTRFVRGLSSGGGSFLRSVFLNDNVYKTKKNLLMYRVYYVGNNKTASDDRVEIDTNVIYNLRPSGNSFLRYRVMKTVGSNTYIRILKGVSFSNSVINLVKDSNTLIGGYTNFNNSQTIVNLVPINGVITKTVTTNVSKQVVASQPPITPTTTTLPSITIITTTVTTPSSITNSHITNTLSVTNGRKDSVSVTTSTITPFVFAREIVYIATAPPVGINNPNSYYFKIKDALEPNNSYLAAQRIKGMPITMPFKYRPNRRNIEGSLNLGYAFGYRLKMGNNPYKDNYINVIPVAFAINSDNYIFSQNGQDSQPQAAVSLTYYSVGITCELSGFNFGFFTGWDMMFGANKNWVNQNMNWISFGIGYKFASTN